MLKCDYSEDLETSSFPIVFQKANISEFSNFIENTLNEALLYDSNRQMAIVVKCRHSINQFIDALSKLLFSSFT